jgi:hypothetical protein
MSDQNKRIFYSILFYTFKQLKYCASTVLSCLINCVFNLINYLQCRTCAEQVHILLEEQNSINTVPRPATVIFRASLFHDLLPGFRQVLEIFILAQPQTCLKLGKQWWTEMCGVHFRFRRGKQLAPNVSSFLPKSQPPANNYKKHNIYSQSVQPRKAPFIARSHAYSYSYHSPDVTISLAVIQTFCGL